MNKSLFNVDAVKAATAKFATDNGYTAPEVEPSDRAKKVAAVIGSGAFGCQTAKVRELASVLLGETLPGTGDCLRFVEGSVVVPVANRGSHNYELGQPVLVVRTDGGGCVRANGTTGNNLDWQFDSNRPATPEEIDAFFAA